MPNLLIDNHIWILHHHNNCHPNTSNVYKLLIYSRKSFCLHSPHDDCSLVLAA